jgi:hypothetical protein
MNGDGDALSRAGLVNRELALEEARKESLEKRGITVITASGVIVTLIFAFSAAVAKGNQFGNFNSWEKILLGLALTLFIVSSLFGLATNRPRNYGVLPLKTLRGQNEKGQETPSEPISEETLQEMINVVEVSRERNDVKASALVLSITLQSLAVLVVGITIMFVVK